MFKHYLTTAWHNYLRFKTTTIISVVGLALGLACFIAAITALTYIESADRQLPNSDRIVMVWQRFSQIDVGLETSFTAQTSTALAPAMRKEFPELVAVAQIYGMSRMPIGAYDRQAFLSVAAADPDYLRILDLPRTASIGGNPLSPPRGVVISEAAARRLFGSVDALGKTLRLRNSFDLTVTAVLTPLPRPSHIGGDYGAFEGADLLISRDTEAAFYQATTGRAPGPEQWGVRFGSATYALLPTSGLSSSSLESGLRGIHLRNGGASIMKSEFRVAPLSKAFLQSLDANLLRSAGGITTSALLMVLAFTVLGVACSNYANLALAQASAHAKEIGLRRTIGARRTQLAMQAFVEAACHVIVAIALALALDATIASVVESNTATAVLNAAKQSAQLWIATSLLAPLVAIGIALYPALTLSRVRPAQAIRTGMQDGNRLGARLLLGAQFVATSTLVVILSVVYVQNTQARAMALRPSKDLQVTLNYGWNFGGAGFDTWRNELLQSPAIRSVSTTSNSPWTDSFSGTFPLTAAKDDRIFNAVVSYVSYDIETALDLNVIAGRSFNRSFGDIARADTGQPTIMIDATLARQLGYNDPAKAVGQIVTRAGSYEAEKPLTIVGVVADKPLRLLPLMDFVGNAYVASAPSPYYPIVLTIDRNHVTEGLRFIDNTWKKLNPNEPINRRFGDEAFERAYAFYSLVGNVLTAISAITLTISLLGAFGFATFVARSRAHEIGIRKTLGAGVMRISAMLLRDFSKPILIANVIAWPLAYVAVQTYLSLFVQRIELTILPFALSLLFTLSVTWLAVGGQAWRAARLNPASVLRHE